jgi:hypothetical protein
MTAIAGKLALPLVLLALPPLPTDAAGETKSAVKGVFGSPLELLVKHYTPPKNPEESNYFIDLWSDQDLRSFAVACQLTNNHALFINSHGKSLTTRQGTQYAFYPHARLVPRHRKTPAFGVADLAVVMGSAAEQIHNVILSGCNTEGAFSAQEVRRCFVNATNITHMSAGEMGYQTMFRQALTCPSSAICPVYEQRAKTASGQVEYVLETNPSPQATKMSPYIAELFVRGDIVPFRTQVAGKELLVPVEPAVAVAPEFPETESMPPSSSASSVTSPQGLAPKERTRCCQCPGK